MNTLEDFKAFCSLLMRDDPTADTEGHERLVKWANQEACEFGFTDWVEALHWKPEVTFRELDKDEVIQVGDQYLLAGFPDDDRNWKEVGETVGRTPREQLAREWNAVWKFRRPLSDATAGVCKQGSPTCAVPLSQLEDAIRILPS